MNRLGRRMPIAAGIVVVAALLAGFAAVLAHAQDQSRRELEERFALRGSLAARFSQSYVSALVRTQQDRAKRHLAARDAGGRNLRLVAQSLDFKSAKLLDPRGALLAAWPDHSARPTLSTYVEEALAGRVGVSDVVSPAAEDTPVVSLAVPFVAREGRRVLLGSLSLEQTPLAVYIRNALPIGGSRIHVVDSAGKVIASTASGISTLRTAEPELAAAAVSGARGAYEVDGDPWYFTSAPILGTPWQVVAAVPERTLLAPISGPRSWIPWVLFGAFALAATSALLLLARTARQRRLLAEANLGLKSRNDELRELDRLKDEFVALVSHELRTPLTSILGYVRVLLRGRAGELPARQRELLEIVERNANRLVALVGDLLFASKVDAGKLTLEPSRFSLSEVARETLESAAPVAREREIELTLDAPGELELYADRARLAQLFDNLVSNAVKFTQPGGSVSVRLLAHEGEAVLEVADTGFGIPEEEQARLFERFFRASTATDREIQGTGLGLSVAKTIAELHGGTISFASRAGEGTTFRVTLPIGSTARPALAA